MMKKLFAALLVLCLLVSLSACGSVATTTTTTTTAEPSTTTTSPLPTLGDVPEFTVTVIDRTEESESEDATTGVDGDVTTTEGATNPTDTTTQGKPSASKAEKPSAAVTESATTQVKPAIPTLPSTTEKTTTTTQKTTKKTTAPTEKTTKPVVSTTKPTTTTTTAKPTNPTFAYTTDQKHVALPYTQRYHYNLLDKPLQEVYDLIVKAVNNLDACTEPFVVDDKYEENFRQAFLAFSYDNPEYFYVARYYGVVNYGNNKHRFDILYSVANYSDDPTGSNQLFDEEISEELKSRIRAKKAAFDKEVQSIISTIPVNAPTVVKEKMAYESILKACHYNMTAVTDYQWDGRCDDNWTAYGIMMNKKGVCESYSEAFQTLCLQMGINCITISGSVSSGGHMWNAVQLDDGWYMCDITFDDPIGGGAGKARYNYFNRTSLWMQDHSNHSWQLSSTFTVPKCTKTKYSYENYFGGSVWDEY